VWRPELQELLLVSWDPVDPPWTKESFSLRERKEEQLLPVVSGLPVTRERVQGEHHPEAVSVQRWAEQVLSVPEEEKGRTVVRERTVPPLKEELEPTVQQGWV